MAHPVLEQLFGSSRGDGDDQPRRFRGRRHLEAGEPAASTPRPDDPRLERLRTGDKTVLAELYDLYFGDLAALAFRFVREKAVAQDVVHDVFLKVWDIHTTIDVRTTLEAYLFGAVANRARNVVAQTRRDDAVFAPLTDDDSRRSSGDASMDSPSPYDMLESTDVLQMVMAAVAKLPERQRLALTLRLSKDMTYEEIGTVLGITKGSVSELLQKAQAHLKRALGSLLS